MGNIVSGCQWLLEDGSGDYISKRGIIVASNTNIKATRIPLSQLSITDVILEDDSENDSKHNEIPLTCRTMNYNPHETSIVVKQNGCAYNEKKKKDLEFITDSANVPIGISQVKLKAKRRQMLQLALKKRLENQLIFR